jgi:N-acetylneuraminic acid mutarotase
VLKSVWIYDLDQGASGTWTAGPDLPQAMSHMNVVLTPTDQLFVLGGLTATGATDQVLQLSSDGNNWDQKVPLPAPRNSGAAVYDGTSIVYAGGTQPSGEATDTIWALNAAGDGWTPLGTLKKKREKLAAISDGTGTVLFVGGVYQKGGNITYDDVDVMTQRKIKDSDLKLDHPREGASAVKIEGIGLCVLGGNNGHTEVYDWWCQDSSKTPLLPKLETPRAGMALASFGGSIYVVGGYNGPKSLNGTNAVEVFTPNK